MKKVVTTEEIIERFKNKHGDEYLYDRVIYTGRGEKVEIYCKKCNKYFSQTSYHHQIGCGCPKCSETKYKIKKKTLEIFTKEGNLRYNNKFDYSKFIYFNANTKSIIICPIHDETLQTPDGHLRSKYGCKECSKMELDKKSIDSKLCIDEFIQKSNIIHKNFYSYDNFIYDNYHTKGLITCPKHGNFLQDPAKHLEYRGCPMCSNQKRKEECQLYILYDDICNLYKIGITKDYNNRIGHIRQKIKNVEIIYLKENFGHNELNIHKLYDKYRTNHPITHGGYTEWFDFSDIDISEVIENINKLFDI